MRSTGSPILAPALLLPETCGPVARVTQDAAVALWALRQLSHPRLFTLEPITVSRAERAARLAIQLGLRGCDAVYVALAQELDDTLVTFDSEQLARASAAIAVLEPA
jgi:predicted nucleic acid-binding protein